MRPAQQREQRHLAVGINAAAECGRALGEAVGDGIEKFQFFGLRGVVQVGFGAQDCGEAVCPDADGCR